MKILITGAGGQIGHRVALHLATRHHVVAAVRGAPVAGLESVEMDIAQPLSVRMAVDRARPDAVVHCAAMTNADDCEKARYLCRRINVEGTKAVAEEAAKTGAAMFYFSSDLVFDGIKGDYTERDAPNPLSYYAETKLEGEAVVRSVLPDAIIARTAVVVGRGGVPPRGFAEWLVDNLKRRVPVRLYTDQFRSHFYLGDCARAVALLLEGRHTGLFHLSPGRKESRHDFGMVLARQMRLDTALITPFALGDAAMAAHRPNDCSLSNQKLVATTGFAPLSFDAMIEALAKEMA